MIFIAVTNHKTVMKLNVFLASLPIHITSCFSSNNIIALGLTPDLNLCPPHLSCALTSFVSPRAYASAEIEYFYKVRYNLQFPTKTP